MNEYFQARVMSQEISCHGCGRPLYMEIAHGRRERWAPGHMCDNCVVMQDTAMLSHDQILEILRQHCERITCSWEGVENENRFWLVKKGFGAYKRTFTVSPYGVRRKTLVNLWIPEDNVVHWNACSPKLRASSAQVHNQYKVWSYALPRMDPRGWDCTSGPAKVCAWKEPVERSEAARGTTTYITGQEVRPDSFSFEPRECTHGIHFFLDAVRAAAY